MQVLMLVALAAMLGSVAACSRPEALSGPTRRFVAFRDDSGDKVEGDVVIAAPLRAPIADLADEARDVVLLRKGERKALIYLNDGAGALSVTSDRTIDLGAEPVAVVAADFNDDGSADLAIACRSPDTVRFLMNKSDGEFSIDADREIALPGSPTALTAEQFDSEGGDYGDDVPTGPLVDLAVSVNIAAEGGSVLVYHNDGSRHNLAYRIDSDRGAGVFDPIDDIDSGDTDNDKDIDIVIAAGAVPKSSARVLVNRGASEGWIFKEVQRLEAMDSIGPLAVRRVRCVDLFGDGADAPSPFAELLISAQRTTGFPTKVNLVARNLGGYGDSWLKFDAPQVRADLAGADVAPGALYTDSKIRWQDIVAFRPPSGGKFELFKNDSGAVAGAPELELVRTDTKTPAAGHGASVTELDGAEGPEILTRSGYYTD